MTPLPDTIGPCLFARGADDQQSRLSAILVIRAGCHPPRLIPLGDRPPDDREVTPQRLYAGFGRVVWRYDFRLPAHRDAAYRLGEMVFPVVAALSGDFRIAYVSCNGQESGDADRPLVERNAMWRRLQREHDDAPFGLLLHGGDQLYADEVLRSHPDLASWKAGKRHDREAAFTAEMRQTAERFYFERYLAVYAQPEFAALCARVPALMMWDDHDIFDGWGSLPERQMDSPIGRGLFEIARRLFMVFQLGRTDALPPADCGDGLRGNLTQVLRLPHLSIIAPDLRTERRPQRVLGPAGWAAFERALAGTADRQPILIMSSVPLLGPRLSWLERVMHRLPGVQKLEDDLRDQWQSEAHRTEWQRMLKTLERHAAQQRCPIVALSGEIHLATRGEMRFSDGTILHQLVASGIVHPPPMASFARALGWLAGLQDEPLPGQRVSMRPLPGCRGIYTAERNYLVLERRGGVWSATWNLEQSGRTPAMQLTT